MKPPVKQAQGKSPFIYTLTKEVSTMFNFFKPVTNSVTKPPAPRPQPTVSHDVSKAYNQRPDDNCLTETLPNGKPWAFYLSFTYES
jgi:hypothetical protein